MAVSGGSHPARVRTTLAAILTVLVLVPTGVLFAQSWQSNADERDSTRLEQRGVDYLGVLLPLISGLTQAQSAALRGGTTLPATVNTAVAQMSGLDERMGAELRVHERWTGLRGKINGLASTSGNPAAVYQAYAEVVGLALALSDSVRDNAQLARDQDNDIFHLQQAVATELPGTVVQVNRMGDLSLLLANADATQQRLLAAPFGAAAMAQDTLVNGLTDDLQAAVDDTNSATLSGNLVTTLDGFRRGVEALTGAATAEDGPSAATVAAARNQVQSAQADLVGVLLRETSGLLSERSDRLTTRQVQDVVLAALAVLLVVAALILLFLARRRRRADRPAADEPARDGDPGYPPYPDPVGRPAFLGDTDHTRREPSGALR